MSSERARTVIAVFDQTLQRKFAESPEWDLVVYTIRARAHWVEGNVAECEREAGAALAVFPRLGSYSKAAVDALIRMTVELGPGKMRELILASPAVDLSLPLTTALEKELGPEPRVPKEVEEVAEDILRDLKRLRQGKSVDSDNFRIRDRNRSPVATLDQGNRQ